MTAQNPGRLSGPVAVAPRREQPALSLVPGPAQPLRRTAVLVWGGRPVAPRIDQATFERARTGDPASLQALYRELAPAVVQYLRVRGMDDPERGCQDVFLNVIPRIRKAKGIQAFKTQLFGVAHARMVDQFQRRATSPRAAGYPPVLDHRPVPPAEGAAARTGSWVENLLQELAGDQREVVLLRIVAGLSIEETAAVMQRTSGAVKELQRRGLQALRGLLEPAEGDMP
ncbi:RNA polymerase sigma factor [Arthrobacter sp. I2-34]|uniref:RNA polymerase sigma factor n=1 Tax=Arthrobacter hankyongi TaxID=2904801 RepID=A0ABS9L2B5_9MICC|nr:RNA polymerase sigma factor [Arthrobacter hankyongi]MCG2620766.1 RNA polymerase sigma factor [Arthrobacter hankyongi]